jgi:hypothetical protein
MHLFRHSRRGARQAQEIRMDVYESLQVVLHHSTFIMTSSRIAVAPSFGDVSKLTRAGGQLERPIGRDVRGTARASVHHDMPD